jgi:hypothetical protein
LTALNVALVIIALAVLIARNGIDVGGVANALVPGLVSGAIAVLAVLVARPALATSPYLVFRLFTDALIVVLAYALTLRVAFAGPLAELVQVIPGGRMLERTLLLRRCELKTV